MKFAMSVDNIVKSILSKIRWRMAIILTVFHILCFPWCYFYASTPKWETVIFSILLGHFGGAGITCGVHRLWSHKSYKATLPLKIFLALCFASNGQMSIYDWVKIHRQHHKYSDTAADPHDSNRGLLYSHIGWLMLKNTKLVNEKRKQIDVSDLENDKLVMFDRKYSLLIMNTCVFLPVLVPIYVWGENWKCALAWVFFIKNLLTMHAGMTVNSLSHKFGYKPYNKNIKPTDNILISLYSGGEGIHNYHHTFPCDYKCAETVDFANFSTFWIRLWSKMGLAYDLKEPKLDLIKTMVTRLNSKEKLKTTTSNEKVKM